MEMVPRGVGRRLSRLHAGRYPSKSILNQAKIFCGCNLVLLELMINKADCWHRLRTTWTHLIAFCNSSTNHYGHHQNPYMRGHCMECTLSVWSCPHPVARQGLCDALPRRDDARRRNPPIHSVRRYLSTVGEIHYD